MTDCLCSTPDRAENGFCRRCGGFACPYARTGQTRCPEWRCDCFIDNHPDSPFDLHPEDFIVGSVPDDGGAKA